MLIDKTVYDKRQLMDEDDKVWKKVYWESMPAWKLGGGGIDIR